MCLIDGDCACNLFLVYFSISPPFPPSRTLTHSHPSPPPLPQIYASPAHRDEHEDTMLSKMADHGVKYPMIDKDINNEWVIVERTLRYLKMRRIMHPRDPVKMVWDAMLGLIIFYRWVVFASDSFTVANEDLWVVMGFVFA